MGIVKTCLVKDCGKAARKRERCHTHYGHWRAAHLTEVCSEQACIRPAHARGLCTKHYQQQRPRQACTLPGCVDPQVARGWCNAHWKTWRTYGDPLYEKTTEERFWEKVDFSGRLPKHRPDLGPCWLWAGAQAGTGYGHIRIDHHAVPVHRYAYELLVGPIPEGLQLDHLCRVRHCCRPEHLEAVTQRENVLRGTGASARHARKTHCPRGHEYTPENTYRYAGRVCRRCASDHARAANRRYKESLAR